MRIGPLRHRIALQSRGEVLDPDTGILTEGWTGFATVWASVEPVSAREFVASQATQAQVTTRIVIRHRAGVLPTMRALHRGTVYNIEGVLPDKASGLEYITLACSTAANESGA